MATRASDHVHVDSADGGMVVSDSTHASRVGREILRQGGNAVDAAVATAFALAVCWPEAGNIGGGGFMLIRPPSPGVPDCIDYRESAPANLGETPWPTGQVYAHRSVGVPGTIKGLAAAHEKYGNLPWPNLIEPAVALARQGVPVDRFLARSLNLVLQKVNAEDERFAEFRRVYGKSDGGVWHPGDRLQLPDLANTLERIAANGSTEFYTGTTSQALVEEMARSKGWLKAADLVDYQAISRTAVIGEYRGFRIIAAPLSSSGGTCVVQALNILENFDLASRDRYDPVTIHLLAEVLRRAFASRAQYLTSFDEGRSHFPPELLTKQHAKELAKRLNLERATDNAELDFGARTTNENPDTTHFSVVDSDGMAVSNTYTLRSPWGARIVVPKTGILLNNLLANVETLPPNLSGKESRQSGTAARAAVQPRQRLVSSQSPTIVEKDGELLLVTGSPGGRSIISTVLCILVNLIDFEMSPAEAIRAPRLHHQWNPDVLELERAVFAPHWELREELSRMGHRVRGRSPQGSAHSIAIDSRTGNALGIADYRRGGRPAGLATDLLACWDFADPAGVPLTECESHSPGRWTDGLRLARTDGVDCLRIQHDPKGKLQDSQLDLQTIGASHSRLYLEVKIAGGQFVSEKYSEQLRVAFMADDARPIITAQMVLQPSDAGIQLRGEALGGGEPIQPMSIFPKNRISQPIVVRLAVDTDQDTYSIAWRMASQAKFENETHAKIAPDRLARFARLGVRGYLTGPDEFIAVDRFEVRK